ncbi:MAG: hypothetical protein FWH38_06370 [Treponema sp.]|nr:hypothetical protein [Treponema sp.]
MKFDKAFAVLAACMAIAFLSGCRSGPKPAPGIKVESTAKVETIEHSMTAFGRDVTYLPPWLSEYIQRNGTRSVEALPEYKNTYVIVGIERGPELQQVVTWANNFNVQQQIGATISTRVASVFKAHENLLPDDDAAKRKYDNAINTLVNASYTGARKESEFWVHQKITEKGSRDSETRYTYYVLYSIDKSHLNEQIRNEIAKLKSDNPELAAAFDAITAQLLEKGLDWE